MSESLIPNFKRDAVVRTFIDALSLDDNTFSFESVLSRAQDDLARMEEDYIAGELIKLGWTPPPNSRWVDETDRA